MLWFDTSLSHRKLYLVGNRNLKYNCTTEIVRFFLQFLICQNGRLQLGMWARKESRHCLKWTLYKLSLPNQRCGWSWKITVRIKYLQQPMSLKYSVQHSDDYWHKNKQQMHLCYQVKYSYNNQMCNSIFFFSKIWMCPGLTPTNIAKIITCR